MWWCDSPKLLCGVGWERSFWDRHVKWYLKNEKEPILTELREYLIKKYFEFIIDIKVNSVLVVDISYTAIIFSWVPTRKLYHKLLNMKSIEYLKMTIRIYRICSFYYHVARFHTQIAKVFWLNFICSKGSEWMLIHSIFMTLQSYEV